jgi:hypothetical protein
MTPDEKMDLEKMRAEAMKREGETEDMEDEVYASSAPKGRFSGKALNALVDATNRLLPLFGVTDAYPKFGGEMQTTLPPAFMRVLSMFQKAIGDAVAEGVLPEDASIDLTIITDDSGLQGLGGRLGMAAKAPGFKRFLKTKVAEAGAEEMKEGEYGEKPEDESEDMMSEDKTNALFTERM